MSDLNVKDYMAELGRTARIAARVIAAASTGLKNKALLAIAEQLDKSRITLVAENQKDLAAGKANGLDASMLDRLALKPATIDGMIEGLRQVAALPDPCGEINDMSYRPSGIQVGKMRRDFAQVVVAEVVEQGRHARVVATPFLKMAQLVVKIAFRFARNTREKTGVGGPPLLAVAQGAGHDPLRHGIRYLMRR